jgi:hypothetical protein
LALTWTAYQPMESLAKGDRVGFEDQQAPGSFDHRAIQTDPWTEHDLRSMRRKARQQAFQQVAR